jgi:hypothetical protein
MISSCALDQSGLSQQRERYQQVGQGARIIDRTNRTLIVELDQCTDAELVSETIATERECCPFFKLAWNADQLQLIIAVTQTERQTALDAIAFALRIEPPARLGSGS